MSRAHLHPPETEERPKEMVLFDRVFISFTFPFLSPSPPQNIYFRCHRRHSQYLYANGNILPSVPYSLRLVPLPFVLFLIYLLIADLLRRRLILARPVEPQPQWKAKKVGRVKLYTMEELRKAVNKHAAVKRGPYRKWIRVSRVVKEHLVILVQYLSTEPFSARKYYFILL